MARAITNTKAAGRTTFFCLSNANAVFISTILKVSTYMDFQLDPLSNNNIV